jgi:hypothetical protein
MAGNGGDENEARDISEPYLGCRMNRFELTVSYLRQETA